MSASSESEFFDVSDEGTPRMGGVRASACAPTPPVASSETDVYEAAAESETHASASAAGSPVFSDATSAERVAGSVGGRHRLEDEIAERHPTPSTVSGLLGMAGAVRRVDEDLDVAGGSGAPPMDAGDARLSQFSPASRGLHPLATIAEDAALLVGDGASETAGSSAGSVLGATEASAVLLTAAMDSPPAALGRDSAHTTAVRVRTAGKARSEFGALRCVQTLSCGSPVFRAKFAPDGSFLAAACDDGRVLLYAVRGYGCEDAGEPPRERSAHVFEERARHVWTGHAGAVLDVAWGRGGFVLSASMDRSVRLWHVSRAECLGVFRHPDFVTSVAFHPRDERVFVTGALDCRVRVWSVAERRVLEWKGLPPGNMVTAVAFTAGGARVLAGTATGVLLVFDVSLNASPNAGGATLAYASQIHVHSRRGANRVGKKICALRPLPGAAGDERVLVSSNDSRLRLYTLRDKSVVCKYVGHANAASQIDAAFSDDGEYIVAGSEDRRVYVWSAEDRWGASRAPRRGFWAGWLGRVLTSAGATRRVRACESFEAGPAAVSSAVFAPAAVAHRLQTLGLRPVLASAAGATDMDAPSLGAIIVACDLGGAIRVFENSPVLDAWLSSAPSPVLSAD